MGGFSLSYTKWKSPPKRAFPLRIGGRQPWLVLLLCTRALYGTEYEFLLKSFYAGVIHSATIRMMEFTDSQAVEATLQHPNSFLILVERYQSPLMRYIKRLGIDDGDTAKDILQESFIKAYMNLNDYDQQYAFSAWMYRIAHNETMMHFRRMKSRPHIVRDQADTAIFDLIVDDLDIAKETDSALQALHVSKALQDIKQEYRDVIILRFFEHKSYGEISDILHIPGGTVATYLARGKVALKRALREYHITDDIL